MTSILSQRNIRPRQDTQDGSNDFWWTTSGGSTFIPSSSQSSSSDTSPILPSSDTLHFSSATPTISEPSSSTTSPPSSSDNVVTITSSTPIIITQSASTFTSFSETTFLSTHAATALPDLATSVSELQVQPVCIGDGLDAQSIGLISTIVAPSVIGLVLWVSSVHCCGPLSS